VTITPLADTQRVFRFITEAFEQMIRLYRVDALAEFVFENAGFGVLVIDDKLGVGSYFFGRKFTAVSAQILEDILDFPVACVDFFCSFCCCRAG